VKAGHSTLERAWAIAQRDPNRQVRPAHPWRAVCSFRRREGRGSVLGPDTVRRARWWELELECGHRVERFVRYRPQDRPQRGGTQHRSGSDVLPAPRRVRCELCR
jgi:hypothetical protein